MNNNYSYALTELLKDEGGYTNDPSDRGGATNYGITITDYRKYIKPNATPTDVKNMKVDEAKTIYKSKYWDAVDGDNLPAGVDYTVFDYGVHSGISRANKIYKSFAGLKDPVKIINAINDERTAFLTQLSTKPGQAKFKNGWLSRVARVRTKSVTLTHTDIKSAAHTTGMLNGGAATVAIGATAVATATHVTSHTTHWAIAIGLIAAVILGVGIYIHERNKNV